MRLSSTRFRPFLNCLAVCAHRKYSQPRNSLLDGKNVRYLREHNVQLAENAMEMAEKKVSLDDEWQRQEERSICNEPIAISR